jgi:FecR-like protein
MKKIASFSIVTISALILAALGPGKITAQHLISSKAGFVNRVDGKVYITRQDSQDNEAKENAALGSQMNDGDQISTESGSYVELLLNPGSYIRVNEKSEIRAVNTELTRVRFEVIRGSAMIEVGEVNKQEPLEIITPQGSFFIRKTGLQRLDVREGMTLLAVRQGEVQLGTLDEVLNKKSYKIGRGKVAQLKGEPMPMLAKLDKDAVDEFDKWSFSRAEVLMAANQRALHSSSLNKGSLAYGWLFDPFHRCYTYIPRGSYWSPYGFGFFNSFNSCWDCYFPPTGYSYGYVGSGGGSNRGATGNGSSGRPAPPPRVVCGIDRSPVRREIERYRNSDGGFNAEQRHSGRDNSNSSSSPAPTSQRSGGSSSPSRAGSGAGARPNSGGGWHGGGSHGGGGRPGPSRPRSN